MKKRKLAKHRMHLPTGHPSQTRDPTELEIWGDGTAENPGLAFLNRDPKRGPNGEVKECKLRMLPFGRGKLLGAE
jgi:hypothetical protein